MYDCETWRCEVADDGQGILAQDLNFVGQIGWTRYGMPTISNSWILNIFLSEHLPCSKYGIRPSAKHVFGHLGRSLAFISAVAHVTITSSVTDGVSYCKKIGDPSEVQFCDGFQLLTPGTRVICSNMFERSRSSRQKQQIDFRIQHSRLVRFLGMKLSSKLSP